MSLKESNPPLFRSYDCTAAVLLPPGVQPRNHIHNANNVRGAAFEEEESEAGSEEELELRYKVRLDDGTTVELTQTEVEAMDVAIGRVLYPMLRLGRVTEVTEDNFNQFVECTIQTLRDVGVRLTSG